MASDGVSATSPPTGRVIAAQTRDPGSIDVSRGKDLPPGGNLTSPTSAATVTKAIAAPPTATPAATKAVPADKPSDAHKPVTPLDNNLNDSGRPDQFRLATSAGAAVIQQINPTTGDVVGEYSEAEFPTLAQGLGGSGSFVDTTA